MRSDTRTHQSAVLSKIGSHPKPESVFSHPSLLSPTVSSSCREVSEPSAAAVTEVEPDSESSMAQQPASGAEPENSENRLEEVRSLRGWGHPGLCSVSPLTYLLIHIAACVVDS